MASNHATTSDQPFLTVEEAAERLRTPVATLYAWRHRGGGPPCAKVGRRLLYPVADLDRFVANLTQQDGAA
jgi:excisionase family DNA binding protein